MKESMNNWTMNLFSIFLSIPRSIRLLLLWICISVFFILGYKYDWFIFLS